MKSLPSKRWLLRLVIVAGISMLAFRFLLVAIMLNIYGCVGKTGQEAVDCRNTLDTIATIADVLVVVSYILTAVFVASLALYIWQTIKKESS